MRVIIKFRSNKVIHAKSVGDSVKSVPSSGRCYCCWEMELGQTPRSPWSWREGSEVTRHGLRGFPVRLCKACVGEFALCMAVRVGGPVVGLLSAQVCV